MAVQVLGVLGSGVLDPATPVAIFVAAEGAVLEAPTGLLIRATPLPLPTGASYRVSTRERGWSRVEYF